MSLSIRILILCFLFYFALPKAYSQNPVSKKATAQQQKQLSGNPVFPGWYADPEAHIFGKTYWIYPTYSAPYQAQVFLDAFPRRIW